MGMMRKYISFSLTVIDVDGFIMQAPAVLVHPHCEVFNTNN